LPGSPLRSDGPPGQVFSPVVTKQIAERFTAFDRSPSKHHHNIEEGLNAVAQGDNGGKGRADTAYTATLPSDFNQTLRLSLTKSLAQYYAPLEEIPPEIRELLARLDEQKH
jgi:hypothetical protein